MPRARDVRSLAALALIGALGSCNPVTALLGSDFSIAPGSSAGSLYMCTSHTASFCGGGDQLKIPIIVTRTNYDGDIAVTLSPAGIEWLQISVQPVIPGQDNHKYEPSGWDGTGYVRDQGKIWVIAFSMGATVPESAYGAKSLTVTGTGPDGKTHATSVTFTVTH